MAQNYLEDHVDRLRLQLEDLHRQEANIQGLKALVLQEILMTRRQISFPERYIAQSPQRALAPVDYLDI